MPAEPAIHLNKSQSNDIKNTGLSIDSPVLCLLTIDGQENQDRGFGNAVI